MSEWSAGYVTDIGYTFGYYPELNPLRARLAFLNAGVRFPEVGTACELGFGQGVSVNIHAAASTVRWWGNDFNPAHASMAQELAAAAGTWATLTDGAFADFCADPALPDFDFIGLHGIWSWISQDNWRVIAQFIDRKLKPGGVVYVSYNTQPGWAQMAPVRDLLAGHAASMSAPGALLTDRIDASLRFVRDVLGTNPFYLQQNPGIAERLATLAQQDRHYLAHEYFNRDWTPVSFATMHDWLAPRKLDYVCQASYEDAVDKALFSIEQKALLASIPDPAYRETVRDFVRNTKFRRDYWVKGKRSLSASERLAQLRRLRLVMVMPRSAAQLRISTAIGVLDMPSQVYGPLIELFSDYEPHAIGAIEREGVAGLALPALLDALMIMVAAGQLAEAQEPAQAEAAAATTARLNAWILRQACRGGEHTVLASPVTGGAVAVPRIQQLMLLARTHGAANPEQWAAFCWSVLNEQGDCLVVDGKRLAGEPEHLAYLRGQADEFAAVRLPMLVALRVA
jgi:SAM-dependent methyltransferase